MSSAENSNAENNPCKIDCIASIKRPKPRDVMQGIVVFKHKGCKKDRMKSNASIPLKDLCDEMHEIFYK